MQENAAQDIRQNKIFRGNMPPEPPPPHLAKLLLQICSLYCIGQILGLDPALSFVFFKLSKWIFILYQIVIWEIEFWHHFVSICDTVEDMAN